VAYELGQMLAWPCQPSDEGASHGKKPETVVHREERESRARINITVCINVRGCKTESVIICLNVYKSNHAGLIPKCMMKRCAAKLHHSS
jgi:hypothetical protein